MSNKDDKPKETKTEGYMSMDREAACCEHWDCESASIRS